MAFLNITSLIEYKCALPSNAVIGLIGELFALLTRATNPAVCTRINWIEGNSNRLGKVSVLTCDIPAIDPVKCGIDVVVLNLARWP